MKKTVLTVLALVTASSAFAKPIVVASKLDPEAQILGQIILLTIKNAGLEVADRTNLGDTGVIRKAIIAGEIDIYPEYTGNAVYFFPQAQITPKQAGNPRVIYGLAGKLDAQNGITWLKPANVNNTWVIAVPQALASSAKLKTVADLARYVKKGGTYKIAGSPEFFNRPDTYPAFEEVYGFKTAPEQKLTLAGATPVQTQQAASNGTNGVNAAMAYGTDATLNAFNLLALADPKGAQAVYQPSPIVRTKVLKEYPQISALLNKTFATLDATTLQKLNGQVALDGRTPADVAGTYLRSKNLIK